MEKAEGFLQPSAEQPQQTGLADVVSIWQIHVQHVRNSTGLADTFVLEIVLLDGRLALAANDGQSKNTARNSDAVVLEEGDSFRFTQWFKTHNEFLLLFSLIDVVTYSLPQSPVALPGLPQR